MAWSIFSQSASLWVHRKSINKAAYNCPKCFININFSMCWFPLRERERERESNVQRNPVLLFSYMEHFSQSSSLCEYILSFHIHIYKKNETLEVICEKEYFCKSISNCVWCKVFQLFLQILVSFSIRGTQGLGHFIGTVVMKKI